MPMLFDSLSVGGGCFREKKSFMLSLPPSRAAFLEDVKRTKHQFKYLEIRIWHLSWQTMRGNYSWKRDCDKYISVMMTWPPAPRSPSAADKMWLCLYAKISRCKCKANHLYCTDMYCCGAEEDPCKKLSVSNMLMTFERLFSCGFRHFFNHINKQVLQFNLT